MDKIPGPLFDTLSWCAQFGIAFGREPTIGELRAHFDLTIDAARRRIALLCGRGLLRAGNGGKGGRTPTRAGIAALDAERDGKLEVTRTGPRPAEQPTRQARRFLGRLAAGWSLGAIAEHYGVSRSAVAQVRDRWQPRLQARELAANVKRAQPRTDLRPDRF